MDRLAIHTMTTKPWSLQQAVSHYADRGVGGISVWVEAIEAMSPSTARQMIDDAGLKVPALVRGGFFCDDAASVRQTRIDHNRELIQTAATIGAEMLVLVVGATPRVDLSRQRGWVREGIEQLVGDATAAGVKLAIEPLHPMYAGDKSCINRLAQAREICHSIDDKIVGVAIDVYHVWWDPDLQTEIEMLGRANQIFGFHLCDWRVPTRDLLTDRAIMGDGCIDIARIREMVQSAGFDGWNEVEIFSDEHWAKDQSEFLDQIIARYKDC